MGKVGFEDSVEVEVGGGLDVDVEWLGQGGSWVEKVADCILNNKPSECQFTGHQLEMNER